MHYKQGRHLFYYSKCKCKYGDEEDCDPLICKMDEEGKETYELSMTNGENN